MALLERTAQTQRREEGHRRFASLCLRGSLLSALFCLCAVPAQAQEDAIRAAMDKGLAQLASQVRESDSGAIGSMSLAGETALAGLALMADGNLPGRGPYGPEVERCLNAVLAMVREDGLIAESGPGNMYGHGYALLFLTQILGQTDQPRVRDAILQAVDVSVRAQSIKGGWRYHPWPQDEDVSVTVCQVKALRAARDVGMAVPGETMDKAMAYVRSCQGADGSFGYRGWGGGTTLGRTGAGLSSLFYGGEVLEDQQAGLIQLRRLIDGTVRGEAESHAAYGWFYAAQALYQAGEPWWSEDGVRLMTHVADQLQKGAVKEPWEVAMGVLALSVTRELLRYFSAVIVMVVLREKTAKTRRRKERHGFFASSRLCGFLIGCLCCLSAWAQDVRVTDLELVSQTVTLQSWQDGQVRGVTAEGETVTWAEDQVQQLQVPGQGGVQPTGWLLLMDGQRLTGQLLEASGGQLRWRQTGTSAPLFVELDDVVALVPQAAGGRLPENLHGRADGLDALVLKTDLVLTGLVDGFVRQGDGWAVQFVSETGDSQIVPVSRLAALQLGQVPEMDWQASWLELSDGARLRVSDVQAAADADGVLQWTAMHGAGRLLRVPLRDVQSFSQPIQGHGLLPPERLAWQFEPGDVFGVRWPIRQKGDRLVCHAPATLTLTLPEGATRLHVRASLDTTGVPADRAALAGCRLVLENRGPAGVETGEIHLSIDRARHIWLDLSGRTEVMLHLAPGKNGPVLDRVILEDWQVQIKGS